MLDGPAMRIEPNTAGENVNAMMPNDTPRFVPNTIVISAGLPSNQWK